MEDPFMRSPLCAWELPTEYDRLENRYHPHPSGSDCWRAVNRLGSGSFGEVWQERCLSGPSRNAVRAVKHLRKRQSNFPNIPIRELLALITFSDPHKPEYQRCFVQFLGWFENDQNLFIVMEHVKYGDLQKFITRPFTEPEAALIVVQIAHALQYMHKKQFVHRDIKPSNILVSCPGPEWHVKLADFGIAKNTDEDTMGTRQIGSPGYMAPELYGDLSDNYTSSIDIWALGAVAFCLLTGFPPFRTIKQLLDYARDFRAPSPLRLLGSSSGFCMSFVSGTMADLPERRLTIEHVIAHDWLSVDSGDADSATEGVNLAIGSETLDTWTMPSNSWSRTHGSTDDQKSPRLSQVEIMTKLEDPEDRKPNPPHVKKDLIAINMETNEHKESENVGIKSANSRQRLVENGHRTSTDRFTWTGWMKKRKTVNLVLHEWKEYYFTLKDTRLVVYDDEEDASKYKATEYIDIEDFEVACTSLASFTKLGAGLFKKREVISTDALYAFSLIPSSTNSGGTTKKSHHFAVKSRPERIDWMRELMLAKAIKKIRKTGAYWI